VLYANNNGKLNRQFLAWNEMGARPFFDIKAGGVGLSRKPGDQTKNSFSNRQIVSYVPFFTFFAGKDNANKIDLTPISVGRQISAMMQDFTW
jgi:hypothetical protein